MSRYRLILFSLFLITVPFLNPLIRGDGVGYYAYVRSLVIDGDLNFKNEFISTNIDFARGIKTHPEGHLLTATGHYVNQWSVGSSILWLPFFLLAHLFVKIANLFGVSIQANGYSFPYIYLVSFGTLLYAFAGLFLIFLMVKDYYDEKTAFLSTIAVWLASSIPVYMYFQPSMSHAHSLFLVALNLFLFQKIRKSDGKVLYFAFGISSGLMIVTYYINAIFLVLPLALFGNGFKRGNLKGSVSRILLFLGGMFLGLLPHFLVKKIIYGTFFVTGYEWSKWHWLKPRVWGVLFSSFHGLFSWTPVLFLAVVGLLIFVRRDKLLAFSSIAAFLVFTYIISCFSTWHGISSYGNRFFISFYPVFAIGLASVFWVATKYLGRKLVVAVLVLSIVWNLGFIFQWGVGLIPKRAPIKWREMFYNQFFIVPRKALALTGKYFTNRVEFREELIKLDRERYKWEEGDY